MRFWWVNHKQTHLQEIEGGYIWSPKNNRNGSRNQTYINLTKTTPGDIVYSYAYGHIKAIGVVVRHCSGMPKPTEFGRAGDYWSDDGWLVYLNQARHVIFAACLGSDAQNKLSQKQWRACCG